MAKQNIYEKIYGRGKGLMSSFGKKNKGTGVGLLGTLNLYSRLAVDKITKGSLDLPPRTVSDEEFYYSTNRIFTNKSVKKMYILTELPAEIKRGFISDARRVIRKSLDEFNRNNDTEEWSYLGLVMDSKHYDFNLEDRKTRGKWQYYAREHEKMLEKMGNRKLEDELLTDKYSEGVKRKVLSFLYMKEALEEEDASFFKTNIILELVASTSEALDKLDMTLKSFLYELRVQNKEIFIQTNQYNKAFTPTNAKRDWLLNQMYEGDVFADDTLVSLTIPTHGVVGDEFGIYHGVDIQTRNLVMIDFSKGSEAKNILLTAQTGKGKSNYSKMIYTYAGCLKETYSVVVFDYEGTEYLGLGRVEGAKFINFTEQAGSYINTMVISDLTGIEEIDSMLYIDAIKSTERIFHLLCDERDGMTDKEQAMFSDAINEVYRDFNVLPDQRHTWAYSQECTFFHIYQAIKDFKNRTIMLQKYGEDAILDFEIKLQTYFSDTGTNRYWFRTALSMQELYDSQNIIIGFGMGKQSSEMSDDVALALRQLFAGYLVTVLANKNKARKIRTLVLIEELQRYLNQKYAGELLANIASAGRKLGIVAYFIINSPQILMVYDDDSELNKHKKTLLSSITMTIIGASWKKDMEALIRQFDLDLARNVLYDLADVVENPVENHPLHYCFFLKYKGQSTVVRMLGHPDLEDLPLYKTLDDSESAEDRYKREKDGSIKMEVGVDKESLGRALDDLAERERQRIQDGENDWSNRVKDSEDMGRIWNQPYDGLNKEE